MDHAHQETQQQMPGRCYQFWQGGWESLLNKAEAGRRGNICGPALFFFLLLAKVAATATTAATAATANNGAVCVGEAAI